MYKMKSYCLKLSNYAIGGSKKSRFMKDQEEKEP